MTNYPSATNQDPTLYCAYFGGPRDGLKSGDLPTTLSGKKLTGMVSKMPLSQPPQFSLYAVYECTSEAQINGFWEFHYRGMEGPDGEKLVTASPEPVTAPANFWTRNGLFEAGFRGFVPFAGLATSDVPAGPGVYAVLRTYEEPPLFLDRSPAGWFKDRNPSVSFDQLADAWVGDASVLYIGKAGPGVSGRRGLKKRLTDFQRHGAGEKIAHRGGRYVWQLAGSQELLVAWKETANEDPQNLKAELITAFVRQYEALPFANRKIAKAATKAETTSQLDKA